MKDLLSLLLKQSKRHRKVSCLQTQKGDRIRCTWQTERNKAHLDKGCLVIAIPVMSLAKLAKKFEAVIQEDARR